MSQKTFWVMWNWQPHLTCWPTVLLVCACSCFLTFFIPTSCDIAQSFHACFSQNPLAFSDLLMFASLLVSPELHGCVSVFSIVSYPFPSNCWDSQAFRPLNKSKAAKSSDSRDKNRIARSRMNSHVPETVKNFTCRWKNSPKSLYFWVGPLLCEYHHWLKKKSGICLSPHAIQACSAYKDWRPHSIWYPQSFLTHNLNDFILLVSNGPVCSLLYFFFI